MTDKFKLKDSRKIYFYALFVLCIGILSYMMSLGITGNDYWWHVKCGEWIVENMQVPKIPIYSWNGLEQNLDWIAHEWQQGQGVLFQCNHGEDCVTQWRQHR